MHLRYCTCFSDFREPMGLVRITSWYPVFNGSHFGLPPSEIHRMTGLPPKIVWTMTYSHRPHSIAPGCGVFVAPKYPYYWEMTVSPNWMIRICAVRPWCWFLLALINVDILDVDLLRKSKILGRAASSAQLMMKAQVEMFWTYPCNINVRTFELYVSDYD